MHLISCRINLVPAACPCVAGFSYPEHIILVVFVELLLYVITLKCVNKFICIHQYNMQFLHEIVNTTCHRLSVLNPWRCAWCSIASTWESIFFEAKIFIRISMQFCMLKYIYLPPPSFAGAVRTCLMARCWCLRIKYPLVFNTEYG